MRIMFVVLALGVLSGCYGKAAGNTLRSETDDQERRLQNLEAGFVSERQRINESIEQVTAKLAQLETVLEQATEVVKRNSADTGMNVAEMQSTLQALQGQLAEVQNNLSQTQRQLGEQQVATDRRIQSFARRAGIDMPVDGSKVPTKKSDHYSLAEKALTQGDHSTARALMREYIKRYPGDSKADDFQYQLGKSYLSKGRPAGALGEFRKLLANYPSSDVIDKTLYDMGEAFFELHACTDAKSAFNALIKSKPRSPLAAKAKKRLRVIRRSKSTCTS